MQIISIYPLKLSKLYMYITLSMLKDSYTVNLLSNKG